MENKWNKKNALWQLLYIILYVIGYVVVCVCGSIHPIFFVGYQVTAGILLTGILVKGFDRIQAPGVAFTFAAGILLTFLAIGDFTPWHAIPVIILCILAEAVGFIMGNDKWKTIVTKSVIMSFAKFSYYGQIWLNRDFTYEAAVEEMPAGYADTLMNCSPTWTFPVAVILGIVLSILIANLTAQLFNLSAKNN
jgi:hypothetical protein